MKDRFTAAGAGKPTSGKWASSWASPPGQLVDWAMGFGV